MAMYRRTKGSVSRITKFGKAERDTRADVVKHARKENRSRFAGNANKTRGKASGVRQPFSLI